MTPLRFYLARSFGNEPMLASLSAPQGEVLAALAGNQVALVGNARALPPAGAPEPPDGLERAEGPGRAADQGAAIDAADLVVRLNRAPMPTPGPGRQGRGRRTDWLGLAVRLPAADRARLAPERILWMSPKRKRLDWQTAHSPGFYLHPPADHAALAARLGAPPTTGALMIDLILRAPVAGLTLYGFDFFASQSLSGRRTAAQVPHDFAAERAWVEALAAADPRLSVVPPEG